MGYIRHVKLEANVVISIDANGRVSLPQMFQTSPTLNPVDVHKRRELPLSLNFIPEIKEEWSGFIFECPINCGTLLCVLQLFTCFAKDYYQNVREFPLAAP